MEIRCHCTACGAVFRVRDEFAGKRIKCAKCRARDRGSTAPAGHETPAGHPPHRKCWLVSSG